MSATHYNQHIARLIVGAMSIDGLLDKSEQQKVAKALKDIGMSELIAEVGAAIESDDGSFDFYEECRNLKVSMGAQAAVLSPDVFKVVSDVVTHDRFVSVQEATYLASLAKRLELSTEQARDIFVSVMKKNRCRLELAGQQIEEILNPALKELLSFEGATELVGELPEDSLEEMLLQAEGNLSASTELSTADVDAALSVLGLRSTASVNEAEEVWKDTIKRLDLPKMAEMGVSYVSAAIERISKINSAYADIREFHDFFADRDKAEKSKEELEKRIERKAEQKSHREHSLAGDLEKSMTGVGTELPEIEDEDR